MSRSDYAKSLTANTLRLLFASCLALSGSPYSAFAQCSLTCNDGLQVSLDPSGQAQITVSLIAPDAESSCPGALQLRLFNAQGYLLPGTTLDCSHAGQTITAQVKHLASGNSCSGTLEVRDALPPTVVCPEKFIFCNQDATPEAVGFPSMTDNCTPSNDLVFNYFDDIVTLGCGVYHNGRQVLKRIDRTWLVSDAWGNSTTSVQKIWLKHITLPAIVFPPSLDGVSAPALNCGQDPNDLLLTGQPAVEGIPIDNSPDCEFGVTWTDQIVNICPPAGYSVLRTWTAVDFCSGTIANRLQIIKVEDKTPPLITPPDDFTVGTDGFLCTGTVTLPQAETFDSCSAVTLTAWWDYGTGFGPFPGVSEGTHVVTYTATDDCGNSATATARVTIEDTSPPQAICASSIQVSLSAAGAGFVHALTIDEGSFDNCGPATLSISRDDSTFTSLIQVSCADIGPALPLTLKVTDAAGLENFCVTEVNVRDFLKPELACPPDITLTCLQDHTDLSLTGEATATDNCALQSIVFQDIVNIGGCNTGSVLRTWTAADGAGNTKSCVQQIILTTVSDIAVTFPPDVTVSACADPDASLPPATGQPAISGLYCSPLSVTYTDQIFTNAPPACRRILRAWKVIDFCINDPNDDSTGIWQKTQIIDILDNIPPALVIPYDVTVGADQPGCQALVAIPDAVATDCGNAAITNSSPYAYTIGNNASGLYPLGEHAVVFTATDDCGNSARQTLTISVRDLTPPLALCKNDLVIDIDSTGTVLLDAASADAGSADECSPYASLQFAVSPNIFDCEKIGNQQVTLSVADAAGNVAFCSTIVTVADPSGACLPPPPPAFSIEGTIRTPLGALVANIPLTLTGDGYSATADCDSVTGHYIFADVPAANIYSLKPYNNAKWLNGVTTFDLVLISKHILGLQTLDSPFKRIAADANGSGSITTFDIVQLRKLILGISDTITGNTSWRFVDAAYAFPDPANPFATPFPEEMIYNFPDSNLTEQDFTGIKTGDVNNTTNAADARAERDTLSVTVPDTDLKTGESLEIPVSLNGWAQLEGLQFELALDTAIASLEKITFARPGLLGETHVAWKSGGRLAVSWDNARASETAADDALLFVLRFTAKRTGNSRSLLRLDERRLAPEAYRVDNESFAALNLHYEEYPATTAGSLAVLPAYPNPFCDEIALPFRMPFGAEAGLTLTDASGKVLGTKQAFFPKGRGEWRIGQAELPGAGVYFFRIDAEGAGSHAGRFVLMCD